MKKPVDIKRFKFYLLVGLVFLAFGLLGDLHQHRDTFPRRALNDTWMVSSVIVLNFIFFSYIVPFITRKRKYLLYNIILALISLFFLLMLYSFGMYGWTRMGIGLHIYTPFDNVTSAKLGASNGAEYGIGSVFFFGIARHIYNHLNLRLATQQLRIQKQQAELNYLKSQTNPHFLFNTLNNIYSLSRDKSDLAPESILRLSKILRFMLYEAGGDFIAIEDELKIISDYIALEKLRYDESLRVNFNHDVENMKQAIPPLLLIPLVENAFKHGVSETRNQPFVDIHLSVNKRQLAFIIKNSTEVSAGAGSVKENIGLSNLRRQLEMLYTDYNLSVRQSESVFTTTLKINLASHV
ncbi:MAG TPA: histidine kinase [Puia sp.]|jgi:two-component system LytT family sensor kinase|nr:histidine kinase [Puia sp.]